MCVIIVINNGEAEIETPRQFEKHFGYLPEIEEYFKEFMMDACLCQADIEKTFKCMNIAFEYDGMQYNITTKPTTMIKLFREFSGYDTGGQADPIPQEVRDKIESLFQSRQGGKHSKTSTQHGETFTAIYVTLFAAEAYSLALPRIKELEAWKESAMNVMPDYQAIGNVLKVPLGQSVHDKILPAIERMKELEQENERLREALKKAEESEVDTPDLCDVDGCEMEAASGGCAWRESGYWRVCLDHSARARVGSPQPFMKKSATDREKSRLPNGRLPTQALAGKKEGEG